MSEYARGSAPDTSFALQKPFACGDAAMMSISAELLRMISFSNEGDMLKYAEESASLSSGEESVVKNSFVTLSSM